MVKLDPRFLSDSLLYSTVRIEVEEQPGVIGQGTGFFYTFFFEGRHQVDLVVTNRHVVEGAQVGRIRFHTGKDQPTDTFEVEVPDFQRKWVPHPDPGVDLCALILPALAEQLDAAGKRTAATPFRPEHIWADGQLEELRALEEIVMIGYPNGIWDEIHNLPVLRRGSTASAPSVDFRGKSEGLVDIACFPGSSGSPVLVLNEGRWESKSGALMMGNRLVLLGILFAGPIYDAEGKLEFRQIPTRLEAVPTIPVMMHLGNYIKAKELLVLQHAIEDSLSEAAKRMR